MANLALLKSKDFQHNGIGECLGTPEKIFSYLQS
jgi:hypothetical protein